MSLILILPLFVGCWGTTPSPDEENKPPTITSTPITTATVGVLYTYYVNATDPDSDTLTYSLTTNPSSMTINSSTGVISWTPTSAQIGDNNVTVKVSDGGLFDTQSFIITVNPPCDADKPTVITNDVTNIGETTVTANGNITTTGGENCTVRGFQYGLTQTPTWDVHSSGSFGTGSYNMNLSGLTCKSIYYVRAYATNCAGTSYGEWKSFTTAVCPPPQVTTNNESGVTPNSAQLNGNLDSTGGLSCEVWFEYGETTSYGTSTTKQSKSSTGSFSQAIGSLDPNTTYHFRACASNTEGTVYGADEEFTTLANLPGTAAFSDVTTNSIRANWTANGNPAGTQYYCENTTKSTNSGWTTNLDWNSTGLSEGTTYHFQVKAKNAVEVETGWTDLGSQQAGGPSTNLKLTPATQSVAICNQGTVNVVVEDVIALMATSITLNFDATKLEYVSSAPGSFFSSAFIVGVTPGSGSVKIEMMTLAEKPSGTGTIMTVVFHRIAAGNTDICFGVTELYNEDSNPISHTKVPPCCTFTDLVGDFNGDCVVSFPDLVIFAAAYNTTPADAKWNPICDLNGDGIINFPDLIIFASVYGDTCAD